MSSKKKRSAGENDVPYSLVFREAGGTSLTATVIDRILYPRALAWTRLLGPDRDRPMDKAKEDEVWRDNGRQAVMELATAGDVSAEEAGKFISAAAASGVVQVEMNWNSEETGWAARVFPWEALVALASKEERERTQAGAILVVRVLTGGLRPAAATGPPAFGVTASAEALGFDTTSERAAVREGLGGTLLTLPAKSLEELALGIGTEKPRIVHLVLGSKGERITLSGAGTEEHLTERLADVVSAHGPEIVTFSSCFTGRRLAPLAVARGAGMAIGFHGETMDASIPVFFGAFYRSWNREEGALAAMRAGLAANRSQAQPGDLGWITLWSAVRLIGPGVEEKITPPAAAKLDRQAAAKIKPEDLVSALPVICTLEETLNYSVLHNSRGGLFKTFAITKIRPGTTDTLEISVRLDTGLDRPAECHFYSTLPPEPDRQQDLAESVTLPLGSQLLRQRGEIMLGTVEVMVKCGDTRVFHAFKSIKLLPCDEWRDDQTGRHLLPSFIFPRDPAVREILTAAQPLLRALCDQPQAGFGGYQPGVAKSIKEAAELQVRAIWSALQSVWRLDYVSPPPAYKLSSQRLRTPEEILRACRGTCIELALLLASCLEHIGIYPVIFLTAGHAFGGYWTSVPARMNFIDGLSKLPPVKEATPATPAAAAAADQREDRAKEAWMFAEPHHLEAIRDAIDEGGLCAMETTFIPLQRPFAEATKESGEFLMSPRGAAEFDGMLDVQTAREKGVTPLAIISQGIAS